MIIDCHCHAGKGDGLTGPWDTNAPLDDYLRWADAAGIGRTVLFAAFHSDYRAANRQVARIVRGWPDRFYGFAFVHPSRDRGRIGLLVGEAVERYGFLLFGSDGPWLHPGVELAKVKALGFPPREEREVLAGNVLRLMCAPGEKTRPAAVPAAAAAPPTVVLDPWEGDPFSP